MATAPGRGGHSRRWDAEARCTGVVARDTKCMAPWPMGRARYSLSIEPIPRTFRFDLSLKRSWHVDVLENRTPIDQL